MKLTAENIKTVLDYNPETGAIIWKERSGGHGMAGWNGRCAGKNACKVNRDGYLYISYSKTKHYAHRVAWLYVYGSEPGPGMTVDHLNCDKTDNRISNLRLATDSQQRANRPKNSNNTAGYKGVSRVSTGKWRAKIDCNGKEHYLGRFDTPEKAHQAYSDAAHRLFGEFARVA